MQLPILRDAVTSDAGRLSALMRETFVAANGHCSTADNVAIFLDQVYTPERQRAEIGDPNTLTLIVELPSGGQWAGFAQLRFTSPAPMEVTLSRPVELGRIYLSPAFQGQGLATQLMQRLYDETRGWGGDGLWLNVWQEATHAIGFYTKHGFRIVGKSIFTVGDDPKDDWVMVRGFAP